MSTLLIAMFLAFVLQRTLVRARISERNATLGTLALVLSPLYLVLSVTFMSDIFGLFAMVLCLYGCLRALQSSSDRASIAWLCFAVLTNAICGTSRQIAWLGILVMVPSTLWLLRARRRVSSPEPSPPSPAPSSSSPASTGSATSPTPSLFRCCENSSQSPSHFELILFFLDIPFLLLPIMVVFFPQLRRPEPASSPSCLSWLCSAPSGILSNHFHKDPRPPP